MTMTRSRLWTNQLLEVLGALPLRHGHPCRCQQLAASVLLVLSPPPALALQLVLQPQAPLQLQSHRLQSGQRLDLQPFLRPRAPVRRLQRRSRPPALAACRSRSPGSEVSVECSSLRCAGRLAMLLSRYSSRCCWISFALLCGAV